MCNGSGPVLGLEIEVNACLAPLCSVDGCHVMTVEGIGTSAEPHPVQQRIAEMHGSQCLDGKAISHPVLKGGDDGNHAKTSYFRGESHVDSCDGESDKGETSRFRPRSGSDVSEIGCGSRCGFCTPGIVMSLYSTLQNCQKPTLQQVEASFDGNLCRWGCVGD